jgi:hypothetical protein
VLLAIGGSDPDGHMVSGGTIPYWIERCEGLQDVPLGIDDARKQLDSSEFSEFAHAAFDGTTIGTVNRGG